ncbi:MAG TPA: hypothetical protein VJP78_11935, partial [Thermoleophilia bacterium]|nr:hypothetical protein [Thermoleophilia bacterium]
TVSPGGRRVRRRADPSRSPSAHDLSAFSREQRAVLRRLDTPFKIQAYLDSLRYPADDFNRSPLRVMLDRKANCFDGALFAAFALWRLGHPPRIVDLFADNDDDHLLALFKMRGAWGAIAKSNYVGLRFREPVYRSLRELVMSYFEPFYNTLGDKSLRSYTRPISLRQFDRLGWVTEQAALEVVAKHTEKVPRISLLTSAMVRDLTPVDGRSYKAGRLGVVEAGLFRARRRKGRR